MSGSVFSSQQLGEHQSMTPDGFLLCTAVPIARTGVLLYADGEVPVEPDGDGVIHVTRDEDEVFAPIAIASFCGKPVTNDHPPEKVTPENWKTYSVGVVLNPRRGDGLRYDNQFLYADLLIQDQLAILDVREGKREVSSGYDAEYETIAPGNGRQHLIIGNHVALVERGRCGPRCSIGDNAMPAAKKRPAWFDRIMTAHATRDSEVLVDELEKVGEMLGAVLSGDAKTTDKRTADDLGAGGVHVHLHQPETPVKDDDPTDPASEVGPGAGAAAAAGAGGDPMAQIMARLEALEKAVAILAQEGNGDANGAPPDEAEAASSSTPDPDKDDDNGNGFDRKTVDRRGTKDRSTRDARAMVGDSTSLRPAWSDLVARAEILAPGIRMPTFDAKSAAKATFDAMCNFRRRVLKEALVEEDTRQAIESLSGGKPNLTAMTCDSVQVLFNGASELVRQQSTRGSITEGRNYNHGSDSLTDTVRLINQRNRERFGLKA